jgi:hypothetical protein
MTKWAQTTIISRLNGLVSEARARTQSLRVDGEIKAKRS